jgi:hypothetical protein
MMKFKRKSPRTKNILMLSITMFVLSMVHIPGTLAQGLLTLPSYPVLVTHGPWNPPVTLGGTIDIELKNVGNGYDVEDGTYLGWCAEDNHMPDPSPNFSTILYDSTDDVGNLPATYQSVAWNKVNYLLNHKNGTVEEIQAALWIVMGTDDPSNPTFPTTQIVSDMVNAANNNGDNFVPGPNQIVAVLIYADGLGKYGAFPDNLQDTLIEVILPPEFQPLPDIKANNSDGPITVSKANPLSITVKLAAGNQLGKNADWWLLEARHPGGFYHFDLSTGSMVQGFMPTYQGPLFNLGTTQILNSTDLAVGTHTFIFGVDMNMNGSLDPNSLYYDWVRVSVTGE